LCVQEKIWCPHNVVAAAPTPRPAAIKQSGMAHVYVKPAQPAASYDMEISRYIAGLVLMFLFI